VARGESLTSIGDQYGVTARSIQLANKIVNPSIIYVGQKLVIPPAP
jgi:LysM repeat protein